MIKKVLRILKRVLTATVAVLLIVVAVLTMAATHKRTNLKIADKQLFAHRGQACKAPENSFEAIRMAVEDGYSAVEIDIRFTCDSVAVLFHAPDLKHLCRKQGKIEELPLAQVQKLKLYFNNQETDCTITTLDSVFKTFPNLLYYLDVKEPSVENIERLSELIHLHKMEDKTIVAHARFIKHIIHRIKFPDIVSCDEGFNSGKEWILKTLPQRLQTDLYAGFIQKTDNKQMNRLRKMHKANIKIAYGVDESNINKAAFDYGMHYMIVDLPESRKYLDKIEK